MMTPEEKREFVLRSQLMLGKLKQDTIVATVMSNLGFFIMGEKEKFSNTVLQYGGLWQRLVLTSCYVPLFVWCTLN